MRKHMVLLFDALFVFFAVVVYGASATAGFAVADLVWGASPWRRGLALVLGYLAFLHAFVVVVGVVRRVVQPALEEGTCDVGLNKKYIAWGLNSIFQGLFITSFFDRQIHLIFYLKYAYYRAMGMKLPLSVVIGTRAGLRQAELLELGDGVVLGEDSALLGHVSPNGRTHVQGRIRIGERTVIGGRAMLMPGVSVGSDSVVGVSSLLLPNATIGNRVRIGPFVVVSPSARVGDGARLLANAVIADGAEVPAGETWGGNPAARVEPPERAPKERRMDPAKQEKQERRGSP